jgi:hypothetical protein
VVLSRPTGASGTVRRRRFWRVLFRKSHPDDEPVALSPGATRSMVLERRHFNGDILRALPARTAHCRRNCCSVDGNYRDSRRLACRSRTCPRDINFDPLVLPSGIVASDDPLLNTRSPAYSESFTRREGEHKDSSAVSPAETGQGASSQ